MVVHQNAISVKKIYKFSAEETEKPHPHTPSPRHLQHSILPSLFTVMDPSLQPSAHHIRAVSSLSELDNPALDYDY